MATKQVRTAETITALAKAVNRTRQTIGVWRKRPDWPFSPGPPWPIAKVKAWAKGLAPDPAASSHGKVYKGRAEVEAELKQERCKKLRIERLALEGALHDVTECEARRMRQIHAVKAALLALPRSIASTVAEAVPGVDTRQVESIIVARVTAILEAFAGGAAHD